MNDGSRIVARLPFTFAGPSKLTTASEVATIHYLQKNTRIPIPRILDWSDDAANDIGSEYIIMEHATGIPLQQRYYQHTSPNQGPYEELLILANIRAKNVDKGRTINEFADGLTDAGLSRIPLKDFGIPTRPSYKGSAPTHLKLLENGRKVLYAISTDNRVHEAAAPTLFHPDLHKRNIFVSDTDPSVITAIIDWQSCSIEPAFWYADEVPDFAIHAPSPKSSTERVDDSELCAKVYEAATQFLTPKLALSKSMDEGMFRPFRYCYRTWKDGVVAFRHELIETSQEWKALGFPGVCPFVLPAPEEMTLHQKEYRYFEAAQNLKRDLSNLLDCAMGSSEKRKRGNV